MLHCHDVFTTGCPTTVALAIEIARGRVHKIVNIRRFTTYVVNANHFIMAVTGVSVSAWDRLTDADRPLNDSDLARIQSVYPILLLKLDTDGGLLPLLYQEKCITICQMKFVNGTDKSTKNERLLDVLKRRSYANVCAFFNCLRLTNQSHLAEVLQRGSKSVLFVLYAESS